MSKRTVFAILIFAALLTLGPAPAAGARTVSGVVLDDSGCPIVGASVLIVCQGVAVTGTATDSLGVFTLNIAVLLEATTLQISSIGFAAKTINLPETDTCALGEISLAASPHDLGAITVVSESPDRSASVTNAVALREHARRTLIPSDPISALDGPSVVRQGSSHSAQVRVDGTNPQYFLNDLSIGTDPSHYGAFAVIPMPVISEMRFYAQGTPARFGAPSAVDFVTAENFSTHRDGELQLSTIDLTTRVSAGSPTFSLLGSVRKSVLDEIVTKIDAEPDRRTIPPTSFLDLFLSTGWRLNSTYTVTVDQYHVRDKLAFNTAGATGELSGVDTYQKTTGSYVAVRAKALYPSVLLRGSIGGQFSRKQYQAAPQNANLDPFELDLRENLQHITFNLSAEGSKWGTDLEAGIQGDHTSYRDISLRQEGWNFLPPFANSNNAYIYQENLDRDWNSYNGRSGGYHQSVYLSADHILGRIKLQAGIRAEYFSDLARKYALVSRQAVTYKLNADHELELYHGTFAESPTDNILEPYQVLIHANRHLLSPMKTDLWSLSLRHRTLNLSLYRKHITRRPVVTPDFSQVDYAYSAVGKDFLRVRSTGEATFVGGTVSINLKNFPGKKFDSRCWYGYTGAEKYENGAALPYELNAPHRVGSAIDWRLSRRFIVGGEVQVRSGYPFTPNRYVESISFAKYYSPAYFNTNLAMENSRRFSMNAALNLHASYNYSRGTIFLSISNATNRANPIINSSSGYIYDAGILPMIGLEYRF